MANRNMWGNRAVKVSCVLLMEVFESKVLASWGIVRRLTPIFMVRFLANEQNCSLLRSIRTGSYSILHRGQSGRYVKLHHHSQP